LTGPNTAPAPKRDPWTVALHTGPADHHGRVPPDRPIGTGVLIDAWRVLTTASAVQGQHTMAHPVWVAFPKAGVDRRVRGRVLSVRADETDDVAVLVLAEPAPAEAEPAPLLCPDGTDLVGEPWWAFGFPADRPYGSDAHGVIGAALAYGRVRLDTESPLAEGF